MSSEAVTTASTVDDMAREMDAGARMAAGRRGNNETILNTHNDGAGDGRAGGAGRVGRLEAAWWRPTRAMVARHGALASEAAAIADGGDTTAVVTEVQSMAATPRRWTRTRRGRRRTRSARRRTRAGRRSWRGRRYRTGRASARRPRRRPRELLVAPESTEPNDYVRRFALDGSNERASARRPRAVRFGSTGEPERTTRRTRRIATTRLCASSTTRRSAGRDEDDLRRADVRRLDPFPDQDKVCHCADRGAIPRTSRCRRSSGSVRRRPSVVAGENAATNRRGSVVAAVAAAKPRADVFKLRPSASEAPELDGRRV